MIKSTIAIIPARGGSKRIPRKNIRSFAGKPMIEHAISVAQKSKLFEYIVVSTDDYETAEIARRAGAQTPFFRPSELADDDTPTVPVIAHAIHSLEKIGWQVGTVCCIYPAVPFMKTDDLAAGLALLHSAAVDYALPVTRFSSAIQRALRVSCKGLMEPFYSQFELTRTQDLDIAYHDAGQFYWGRRAAWLSNPRLHNNAAGLVIPSWRVIDIDTEEDWQRAEMFHRAFSNVLPD